MTGNLRHRSSWLLWGMVALYTVFFCFVSWARFSSFDYHDFDLAVHAQSVWSILHGSIYSSILRIYFLGNHANFILFLIAPIYFVFRSPLTLLFLQTFFLALAAYPIYRIAKEEVNERLALVIVFLYLFYPALGYVNLFEFHPTVFATAFLAFMFYYLRKGNYKRFLLFMFLSLLCQENIPLIVVPVGIYALFMKKELKWGVIPIVAGIAWFWLMTENVIPYFNQDTVQFGRLYRHLGDSTPEIAKYIVTHPVEVGKTVLTRQKMIYVLQLFAPLCFLPLFDSLILVIFPSLMQHLLSMRRTEHTIYFHYTAEMIPFIIISAIYGFKRLSKTVLLGTYSRRMVFTLILITVAVLSNLYLGPHLRILGKIEQLKKDASDYQKEDYLSMIPDDASVIATFEFLPKLAHRRDLYSFHHLSSGFHTLSDRPYQLPESTEYALIDFNDRLTFKAFYIPGRSDDNLRKFLSSDEWGTIDMLGSIVLFERNHRGGHGLYEILDSEPAVSRRTSAVADGNLQLIGYDIQRGESGDEHIEFSFYWRTLGNTRKDYGCFIDIVDRDGRVRYRHIKPLCYRIYPTYAWQKDRVVKENYTLRSPGKKSDALSVRLGVFAYETGKIYPLASSIPGTVDNAGRINLMNSKGP